MSDFLRRELVVPLSVTLVVVSGNVAASEEAFSAPLAPAAESASIEASPRASSDASLSTIPVADGDEKRVPLTEKPASRPANRLIDEVVVTARKREERLEDVPLSVTAFSAESLEAAGVESAQQLDKVTPGLVFTSTLGFNVVFLRGVGTDAYLPAADPSVPLYVDDIAILPTQGSVDTLGNIERVEVLKGPQGTLFGRNSLGGAIRIVTRDPDDRGYSGSVSLDGGNDSRRNFSAFLNTPLMEGLALAVSGFSQEQDPYYKNTLGYEVYDLYSKGGRAGIKWQASEAIDVKLSGFYSKSSSIAGLISEGVNPAPIICAVCAEDPGLDYSTANNADGGSVTEQYLIGSQIGWKLPWFTTKLILSHQKLTIPKASTDLDGTLAPLVTAATNKEFGKQRTAELRVESDADTPFSEDLTWVGGIFYLKSSGGYHPVQFSVAKNALSVVPALTDFNNQLNSLLSNVGIDITTGTVTLLSTGIIDTTSISGYAQGSYTFLDDFEATLGLRYDEERRSLNDSKLGAVNPVGGDELTLLRFSVPELKTSRYSPRVSLKWQFAETAQVYTSYSIGYLSPTYNSVNFFVAPDLVKQERADAYELGIKGNAFSGLLKYEGALFYTQRDNIISAYTSISSGVAVRFYNAGAGEIKGAELSVQAQPLPGLNPGLAVIAAGSYLDSKYTDFPNGRGYDDLTGLGFGPGSLTDPRPRDFSGNRIVNSPKFTGTLAIAQTIPLNDELSVELVADTYYNSGFYFDAQNSAVAEQLSYQLYNARATLFYSPWNVQLSAYGQNIFEEKYLAGVFRFDTGTTAQLAPPRAYGLRLKWDF